MKYIWKKGEKFYLGSYYEDKIFKIEEKEFIKDIEYYNPENINYPYLKNFLKKEVIYEVFEDDELKEIPLILKEEVGIFVKRDISGFKNLENYSKDFYLENGFDSNDILIIRFSDGEEIELTPSEWLEIKRKKGKIKL